MGWNYLSISKLQRCHRWSLEMDKLFHPTYYNRCNYLSMVEFKLNHIGKRAQVYFYWSDDEIQNGWQDLRTLCINPSVDEIPKFSKDNINIMAADAVAPCVARTSADTVLMMQDNSPRPTDGYMYLYTLPGPTLVQILDCHLISTTSLLASMLAYYWLEP